LALPPSDAELVLRVAVNDMSAMEELYNRYSQPIFSMSYSILRDYAAAEDVTQEIFTALWTRARQFDPERGVFKHWFLHMAHNRVIDEVRKRKRITSRDAAKAPDDPALALEAPGDPAEAAVNRVLFGAVKEALMNLPPEQRIAVVMAYLQGATQQEIAERTGVPLGTVKTRLRLGLIKLRQAMNQQADGGTA
jgi:RNA polymerase sigma-70 factor (ECF subfamily)